VVQGGFHGRTYLTMAMTTSKVGVRAGYQPLPAGVFVTAFPRPFAWKVDEATAVERALADLRLLLATQTAPSETAAFVIEPVLGEGGYLPAPPAFVRGAHEICAEHGILFVADEVQTGFARTGRMFAVEHSGVQPDIMVMAKGIASGFPISAIGARADLMAHWNRGAHGGTYGANPIGCAAALATIDVILDEQLVDRSAARGLQLIERLRALQSRYTGVGDVRGLGLMVAAELTHADGSPDAPRTAAVMEHCLRENHLVLMSCGADGNVVRFMPPLVVSEHEIDEALAAFDKALAATC
jgi:4-aminobutyrate aminotransferase